MTTRWWAPDGAHIGPDERDFELLIPVDDARHDLGAALLALHRVGAAACEEVALHAIPDEISLVQALATARQAFAAPLVESVSKSVGEGPYAGLLVRDTIDDAESAALLVFRTLTSSGVPAQLAAQRAGMVYGVPEDSLSTYLTVAKELRAHPAALADAADRALFGAIEKIATEEFEAKPELVQKATPDEPRVRQRPTLPTERPTLPEEEEYLQEHNVVNDPATGRFIRGSVVGPPAVGKAPSRSTRATRATRSTRATRTARAKDARQTSTRRSQARRNVVKGRDVSRLRRSREEMTETEKNRLISLDPVTWSDGDFLAKLEHPKTQGPFSQIEHELAIGMSTDEWASLQAHLGRDEQGRMAFRMGHIAQEREANVFGRASDYETDDHRKALMSLANNALAAAEEQFANQDIHLPIAVTVDDDELVNMNPDQIQDHVNSQKFDAIAEWLADQGADPYTPENQQYILDAMRMMRSTRSPDNKGDVYHYIPRVLGNAVAPRINVVELVFEPGVLGRDEGESYGSKHPHYVFNPNQVMRIENGRPAVIYDPQLQAFRLRYFITPDVSDLPDYSEGLPGPARDIRPDPNVEKADDYLDEHNVVNGPGGRFVREGRGRLMPTERPTLPKERPTLPEDAVAETPARSARASRSTRSVRASRVTPRIKPKRITGPRQNAGQRQISQARQNKINRLVQGLQRQRLSQPAAKPYERPKRQAVPELVEGDPIYAVISHEQLVKVMTEHAQQSGSMAAPLTNTSLILKLAGTVNDGPVAYGQMKAINKKMILESLYGTEYKPLQLKRGPLQLDEHATEDMDAYKIIEYTEDLFKENPEVQQITVDYNADGSVSFRGNAISAPPVVLIQLQEDLDWKTPMVLKPVGRTPLMDFVVDVKDEEAWNEVDEMRAIRGELETDPEYEWSYEDILENTRVPIQVENPTVEHYMLVNYEEPEAIHWTGATGQKGQLPRKSRPATDDQV